MVLVFKDDAHFLFDCRLDKTLTFRTCQHWPDQVTLRDRTPAYLHLSVIPLHQLSRSLEHTMNADSRGLLLSTTVDERYQEGSSRARAEVSPATALFYG